MKLLRVSAIWCPACILMRPIYERIIKENIETYMSNVTEAISSIKNAASGN